MKRVFACLILMVCVLLLFSSAQAAKVYWSETLTTTTSGSSDWISLGSTANNGVAASCRQVTLAGGVTPDVNIHLYQSPTASATDVFDLTEFDDDAASDGFEDVGDQDDYHNSTVPMFRYVRFTWVTSGSPTGATTICFLQATSN
jgi:hypothetical protein